MKLITVNCVKIINCIYVFLISEDTLLDESDICVATNAELEALEIKTPNVDDVDWAATASKDVTGCKIAIRVHLERGSSVPNVDSPLRWG